jgi:hypothetical protein
MSMRTVRRARLVDAARCLFAAIAAAATLAGCAGDPLNNDLLSASLAQGSPRKSVCIISAIGNTFSVQKIGITVFGNELNQAAIDAWGIDALVAGKFSSQLSQRFDVKRLDYPKGAFASLDTQKSILASDYKDPRQEIRDIARGLVGSQKCDLCIVATPFRSMYSNSNQSLYGLGILDQSSVLFTNVFLFAMWEVRVYDGKTFEVLARAVARRFETEWMIGIHGPYRRVDKSWLPAPGQVAQNAKLKQAMLALVEQSVTPLIAELFPPQ